MKKIRFRHLNLLIVVSLFNAILEGYLNWMLGDITDYAMEGNISAILSLSKSLLLLVSLGLLVSLVNGFFEKEFIRKTMAELKATFLDKMLQSSSKQLYQKEDSLYISNITNDMDRLEKQFYLNLVQMIHTVMTILVSVVLLMRIWWGFVLVSLALAFIFIMISKNTSKPIQKEEEKKSLELTKYTKFITESLNGFEVITQHQLRASREGVFQGVLQDLKHQQYIVERKVSLVDALNGLLQSLVIISLIIVGLFVSKQTGFSSGQVIVIVILFSNMLWPLQQITPLITEMNGVSVIFKSFKDNLKQESKDKKPALKEDFDSLNFKEAALGYDEPILENVNFSIHKGEKVLIVGPSGAGKSTILKTILGHINSFGGELRINEHLLEDVDYTNLISVVDQIGFIFNGSVLDNITMLKGGDLNKALSLAHLENLDENLILRNNGDNLSSGERTRLLLARAHYFNKDVILCDEIMANLDPSVGKEIELEFLNSKQTVINVSHIVFKENLAAYDKYIIVDQKKAFETKDQNHVLKRLLQEDIL